MQFVSNKISVGKAKSFDEICQEFLAKKNASVKTASVKVAEADEAESSGQLDVEPLHQEGESTNQDSVAGGKNDDDGGAATSKDSDKEGEDSGQPKAEGSEKFTNDPKVEASVTKASTKEAGKVPGVPDGTGPGKDSKKCPFNKDEDKKNKDEDEKDEDKDEETKEAGVKGTCDKCNKPNFLCKCDTDEDDDSEEKEEKEEKEASTKVGFKKIANLTSEEKTRLGKYWKNIYPDAFVDALLADK